MSRSTELLLPFFYSFLPLLANKYVAININIFEGPDWYEAVNMKQTFPRPNGYGAVDMKQTFPRPEWYDAVDMKQTFSRGHPSSTTKPSMVLPTSLRLPNPTTSASSARTICAKGSWQEVEEGRGQRLQIPQHPARPYKCPRCMFEYSRIDTVRNRCPHSVAYILSTPMNSGEMNSLLAWK